MNKNNIAAKEQIVFSGDYIENNFSKIASLKGVKLADNPWNTKPYPRKETFYQWKEFAKIATEDTPRLFTPWSDPHQHEWPMDFMYDTVQEAIEAKAEIAPEEDWWLVEVVYEPVLFSPGTEE